MRSSKIRYEYEVPQDNSLEWRDDPSEMDDTFKLETFDVEVRTGEAEAVYERILEAIHDWQDEYCRTPTTIVLGREDYALLDAFFMHNSGHGIESEFSGKDITTVPGRMVHVPVPDDYVVYEAEGPNDE